MLADGRTVKGEVKYSPAAKRHTIVARGKEEGDEWVELIGWQADKKKMVFVGYGTINNNYWVAEYGELAKDKLTGVTWGVLPDGRPGKGTVSLVRVDDNTFEVHLDMTVNNEKFSDVGKFIRKKD